MLRKLMFIVALLVPAFFCGAAETYGSAEIDQNGQLRIITGEGREIVPALDEEQTGFDRAAISSDRQTVGWLALYPNCCTSYPIPLKLVLYSGGRVRSLSGNELPVWRWCFLSGGKQVAFEQETVHGGLGVHYELRDVATGHLDATYEPDPDLAGNPPPWVVELDAKP